jgi:hypothetical protein
MFTGQDIELLKNNCLTQTNHKKLVYMNIRYLNKGKFFSVETSRKHEQKFSKKAITPLQKLMDTNPFRFLLVFLRSSGGSNMSPSGKCHLE